MKTLKGTNINLRALEPTDLEFLFQLGLIKDTDKGRKPTIASILLLGQDGYLRGLLPRPVIDCQRYLFTHNNYSYSLIIDIFNN